MRVIYPGPSAAVNVVADGRIVTAARAEPVDVPAVLASELVAQGWVVADAVRPDGNAKKAEWVAYAVARGGQLHEVRRLTRAALIERFGGPPAETATPGVEPTEQGDE